MFLLSIFSSTLLYPNPKTLLNCFFFHFFLIHSFTSSSSSYFPFLLLSSSQSPTHILVKDFKIFRTRSLARVAFLLLSPADLLSKERSWFAISWPWTSSSIAFFLLEGKLSGQVHSIVLCVWVLVCFETFVFCVYVTVFWVLSPLCLSKCEAKQEGFFEIKYVIRRK